MEQILYPGSVINTINHKGYEYYLCPSSAKHGCIYFGNNLKSFLIKIKHPYYKYVNDTDKYVINCNGKKTYPELLSDFLKSRDEYKIFNFSDVTFSINPKLDVMKIAAEFSCNFIGTNFSFRQKGHYCFEIIVKSYLAAIKKKNIQYHKFNMIEICGFKFYNSRSISNYIYFYIVYKKYKNKEKIYLRSNCNFLIYLHNNTYYIKSID